MPYLHWETDRRGLRAANVIKRTSQAKMAAIEEVVESTETTVIEGTIDRAMSDGPLETIRTTTVIRRRTNAAIGRITHKTVQGQTLLGRMLLLAAALYEAMDALTDETLVKKYLTAHPPLHPRRTLDQSYYWTLKDTRKRDRDQVVYRGTAPSPKFMHHRCFKTQKGDKTARKTCHQCQDDVKKVPRVVMVDQLWMWVNSEVLLHWTITDLDTAGGCSMKVSPVHYTISPVQHTRCSTDTIPAGFRYDNYELSEEMGQEQTVRLISIRKLYFRSEELVSVSLGVISNADFCEVAL